MFTIKTTTYYLLLEHVIALFISLLSGFCSSKAISVNLKSILSVLLCVSTRLICHICIMLQHKSFLVFAFRQVWCFERFFWNAKLFHSDYIEVYSLFYRFAAGKSDKEILDNLLKNSRYDKRLLPPVDGKFHYC